MLTNEELKLITYKPIESFSNKFEQALELEKSSRDINTASTSKTEFDSASFATQLLEALEKGDVNQLRSLMELTKKHSFPFLHFANNFDAQATLVRYLFSPKFQTLPDKLQTQIRNEVLSSIDFSVRDRRIHPANHDLIFAIHRELIATKKMAKNEQARHVEKITNQASIPCYEFLENEGNQLGSFGLQIFELIRDNLVSFGLNDTLLYFSYLLCHFSIKDNSLNNLIAFLKIILCHSEQGSDFIKSLRTFCFQKLKNVKTGNVAIILTFIENFRDKLTLREKFVIADLVLSLPTSPEEKFSYSLQAIALDRNIPINILELKKLSFQFLRARTDDLLIFELVINSKAILPFYLCELLMMHNGLISNERDSYFRKFTHFQTLEEYAENLFNNYTTQKITEALGFACYLRNLSVIDKIIKEQLADVVAGVEKLSADDYRWNIFEMHDHCIFDNVIDDMLEKYGNDERITLLLIRSFSLAIYDRMSTDEFVKWLKRPGMAEIFRKFLLYSKTVTQKFLDKLEKLPIQNAGTRVQFLNSPSAPDWYPLDDAFFAKDDQLALRLYKLGARRTRGAKDATDIFEKALIIGCTELASYLMTEEKSLKTLDNTLQKKLAHYFANDDKKEVNPLLSLISGAVTQALVENTKILPTESCLKEKVITSIQTKAGLFITELAPLNETEAMFLLYQMASESVDNRKFSKLIQALTFSYGLKTAYADNKFILNLFRLDNHLIVREFLKRHKVNDSLVSDYFTNVAKLDPESALLLLSESNIIKYLRSPSSRTSSGGKTLPPSSIGPLEALKLRVAIKKKLLDAYPYIATQIINILKKYQDSATTDDQLPMTELYLLFDKYVLNGDFTSPVLAYLFLTLPELPSEEPHLELSDDRYLALIIFQLIKEAYSASSEQLKLFFEKLFSNEQFLTVAKQLQRDLNGFDTLIFIKLTLFLIRIRPLDEKLIRQQFSLLQKNIQALPKKSKVKINEKPEESFKKALESDDIQEYKRLTREFSEYFQNNNLSHALKLCPKENSKILMFLFSQHRIHKIFTSSEMTSILKELIQNNESLSNLILALSHNIRDPKCTIQSAAPDFLYMFALEKGNLKAADLLMPTYLTSPLLKQTAIKGDAALFKRALSLNIRLEGKEEEQITFHDLEKICINDKDKLTAIALGRIITKQLLEDKFGKAQPKRKHKFKTTNPSGEDKFKDFMHQLELLKRYAMIHAESKVLNDDDIKACDLILKKLIKEYNRCGDTNIEKYFADISIWGQIKPSLKNIGQEIQKLEKKELLSKDIIIAQLEVLDTLVSKKKPEPEVAPILASTSNTKKKKNKKRPVKKKTEVVSPFSETPLVVNKGPSLYGFFEQRKLDLAKAAEQKVDQQEKSPHRLSDSIIAINNDIENTLTEIRNYVSEIPNVHELRMFSEKDCNYLMRQCHKLKKLFWELDDDLSEQSLFSDYKEQLQLLDCSKQDDDTREQLSLFAIQFIISSNSPTKTPSENIEKQKPASATFFQPAILQDDINQFCLKRMEELKMLLKGPDIDAIHFCVFRIVNALGDIYRPARLIRHLLIHRFYDIAPNNLHKLATELLEINLADKRSFLAIERSALYEQSHDFMLQILKPGKSEKVNLQTLLRVKLDKLLERHNKEMMLWHTVLVGELTKQTDISSAIGCNREMTTHCQIIRNKVAHENYKESLGNENKPELVCNIQVSRIEWVVNSFKTLLEKSKADTVTYTPI